MSPTATPKRDLIYVGMDDLESLFQRWQALAREFARSFRVLYVSSLFYSLPRCLLDRLAGKSPRHRVGVREFAPDLWTVGFIPTLPNKRDLAWARNFNLCAAERQLRAAIRQLDFHDYILWLGNPWAAPWAKRLPASLVCYDCFDDFSRLVRGKRGQLFQQLEAELLGTSDVVISTSEKLYEKCHTFNRNVYLVRNGVVIGDYARPDFPVPADLERLPRPVLGFLGAFAYWVDTELLRALALRHPEASVVVVGPMHAPKDALDSVANVHFVGMKPHADIPNYLNAFDVCLIPFVQSELTAAMNPVKFYEYCAAGKPTVSVMLRELVEHQDLCYLGRSQEEFLSGVDRALGEAKDPSRAAALAAARRRLAQENSWEARRRQLEEILRDNLAQPRHRSPGSL